MSPADRREQLARQIDAHVKQTIADGGGDQELLTSMYDYMLLFKEIMDTSSSSEMDALCMKYDGFYQFANLLERLASGIADGQIQVPD